MKKWLEGKYRPTNPGKYRGDLSKITYRSSWERNLMVFLDHTPEVLAWDSERTIVRYKDPVKKMVRRYFVDFKAICKQADGSIKTILIEIKPHKQTMRPRETANKSEKTLKTEYETWMTNQAKWSAARQLCKEKGWEFMIITEKVLFAGIDKSYKQKKKKLG